jgi:hypothetical protein
MIFFYRWGHPTGGKINFPQQDRCVHTEISAARIFYVCRHMVANSKRQVWSIFKSMPEGESLWRSFKLALEDQQFFFKRRVLV